MAGRNLVMSAITASFVIDIAFGSTTCVTDQLQLNACVASAYPLLQGCSCVQDVEVWVPGRGSRLSAEARTAWEGSETNWRPAGSIVIGTPAGTALWDNEQNEGLRHSLSVSVAMFTALIETDRKSFFHLRP